MTPPRVNFDPHAVRRMVERDISEADVYLAIAEHHTTYPAKPLGRLARSRIYLADVRGRTLKVYVLEGTDPPYVTTAAWTDE